MDESVKIILSILGAVTGNLALTWRVIDEFGSFLRIAVKVEPTKNDWITALTTVENKGYRSKKIKYSILLIGPEAEDPVETARFLARVENYTGKLEDTDDIEKFLVKKSVYAEGEDLYHSRFTTMKTSI